MSQRLGIAAALLGDPPVLLFDEPVNGLDPEGIRWVRTLMRTLAGEGRTVFVSSHLLAEMANTADRLVVIGRGKLIASTTVGEFVAAPAPTPSGCAARSSTRCGGCWPTPASQVDDDRDGAALPVRGAAIEVVGELAARNAITLHELSAQRASLEEAYMKLTDDAVEYRAVTRVSAFAVLDAERIKLSTTRSPLWSAVAVAVLSLGVAALQASTAYGFGPAAAGEGRARGGGVRGAGADDPGVDDGDGRIPQRDDPHDVHGRPEPNPGAGGESRCRGGVFAACTPRSW